jgi:hypothetical protein
MFAPTLKHYTTDAPLRGSPANKQRNDWNFGPTVGLGPNEQSSMSELGQRRRSKHIRNTSGSPPTADLPS